MITLEDAKVAMANNGLPAGEKRRYQKCRTCGNVSVREFIPYGLGRGRHFLPCICYCTGSDKSGYDTLEDVEGPIEVPDEISRGQSAGLLDGIVSAASSG